MSLAPIQVKMTVAQSSQQFDMSVAANTMSLSMTVAAPFVVAPIPKNYGLITYNGSILTVS